MPVKQALDTLRELEDGKLLNDMSVEMNELIRQVKKTAKQGSISLKIKILPVNGDTHNVTAVAEITTSSPKLSRQSTLFYTTPECNLSRQDPNQRSIPGLEDVSFERPEVKELDEIQEEIAEA